MTKYILFYVCVAALISSACIFFGLTTSYGYDFHMMMTPLFLPLVIKESAFLFVFFLAPVFIILSFVSVSWDRGLLKYNFLCLLLFLVWFVSCFAFDKATEEDGFLEWVTFWCSFAAACLFFYKGFRIHTSWFLPAFLWFLFAAEEISWGQRLIGFEGPEILTRHNYQSEINFHNFLNPFIDILYPVFFAIVWILMIILPGLLQKTLPERGWRAETGFMLSSVASSGLWLLPLLLFYTTLLMLSVAGVGTGLLTGLGARFIGESFVEMSGYFTIVGKEYVEGVWGLFGLMIALLPIKKPDGRRLRE